MDLIDQDAVPSGWTVKSLESVCTRITSGGTPSRKNPKFYEGGEIPWIKTQELRDGWVDDAEEHITEAALKGSSAKLLPAKTVLMAMYGATVGQLGILRHEMSCNQACCALVVDPTVADYRFVYYSLLARRATIKRLSTGAAQQNLSGTVIKAMRLPFPPLDEQRRIANILGSLDDKIEVNRRMSETLEQMARALFKSWFVDFDPVRAKSEGRDTGLPSHIADLFPDRLVDSELGEAPVGWDTVELGAIAENRRDRIRDRVATVLSAVSSGELVPSTERFTKQVYSKSIEKYLAVEPGDFAYNPSRINIGSIGRNLGTELGAVSPVYVVTRPRAGFGLYLEYFLRLDQTRRVIEVLSSGSVRQSLPYRDFASITVVVPNVGLLFAFESTVAPLIARIDALESETGTLQEIRDALLRELIG